MRLRATTAGLIIGAVTALLITHGPDPSPATVTRPDQVDTNAPTTNPPQSPSQRHEPTNGHAESCVSVAVNSLDPAGLAKQVFLVGASAAAGRSGLAAQQGLGGFLLTGRGSAGVAATARFTGTLMDDPPRIKPLIAVDQEGGAVQALSGPGFSRIPAAETQGTWPADELRASAGQWGSELAKAGVSIDLAPVVDLVPADRLTTNKPIGAVHRQLGSDPGSVVTAAKAISAGLRSAGIGVVYKHFPGLGMVAGNTDYSREVTDSTTQPGSESVDVYRQLLSEGGASVMISTAFYAKLDARQPAAFSKAVVTQLLREDLKFDGVVISDDLADARQVQDVPVRDRAVRFLSAGGDLVIATNPQAADAMYAQVMATATADHAFALRLRESAQRVLTLKASLHLLDCRAFTG
jgi:beta-N-acetylhexosaminidase